MNRKRSESWDKYFLDMCDFVASKSKDRSTKIGSVIVGPDNEIRSTGFNGFCRGIDDKAIKEHEQHWKGRANFVNRPDPKVEARYERPAKYVWTEHAERNAIYNAARCGIQLKGCRIYVPGLPCADCARGIIQSGIVEVITRDSDDQGFMQRWTESNLISLEMFEEAGVDFYVFGLEEPGNHLQLIRERLTKCTTQVKK